MASCSSDCSFGPWSGPECRHGLDFTFFFEQVIFSLVPALALILLTPWRGWALHQRPKLARHGVIRTAKLASHCLVGALTIAYLVLMSASSLPCRQLAMAAATVEIVAVFGITTISWYQHTHSQRPSFHITVYLGIHTLLNMAAARTLWLITGSSALSIVFTTNLVAKLVALLLENSEKQRLLPESQAADYSPEELAGPLNRNVFGWLAPLLKSGYTSILTMPSLTMLSADLKSLYLGSKLQKTYAHPAGHSLLRDVLGLGMAWVFPIVPRLFLLVFNLAQPFLIRASVRYISVPYTDRDFETGNLLIAAFVFTFTGYALSSALYWHLVNRAMLMVRGSLISLIFKSTYYSSASQVHSTESLTLMTVDVDKVMFGFEDLHELWANVLQIAVAVYVLASQMSWASVAPVLVPILCVAATIPAATRIGVAQKDWNQKVQERVDVTASVLSGLREIRMLGIGGVAAGIIQQLRVDETRKSHRFRQLMTAIITLSQVTTILAPLITFALYTVVQNITGELSFSAAQAFTTLSLVNLISGPVSVLVQSFPGFASGISSLARIQDYVIATRSTTCGNPDILPHSPLPPVDEKGSRLLGSSLTALTPSDGSTAEELHVVVKEGTFGWREDAKVLNNINFKIAQGSLTLVTGPVGAGKSTLLWGILGELPFSRGHIWKQKSQTSFCPQTPWLVSGSIRHNIVCGTKYEKEWYDQVIAACSLVEDLRNIDNGDQHEVGNEGRNLSGGQRQRVALARAVYARSPLVILDEPLSGVDIKSAKHIVTALFGPGGLLRSGNTTVIIVSNSNTLLPHADQVVIVQPDGSLQKVEELDSTACDTTLNPAVAKQDSGSQGTHGLPASSQPDPNVQRAQEQAELQRKRGDWGIYLFYLQATGYLNAGAFLFFCLACAFLSQFSVLWVRWWADAAATVPSEQVSTGYYLGIYALLCVLAIVGLAVAAWMLMVRMVTRTATDLHGRVLRTLFLAPTSHFSTIDNGITLNRFNQDMQLLDFHLPLAGVNTFLFACICLVQAVVICTSVSFMAVAIPFCLAVLYFIQSFYLQTSRQLRLLDIEAKAPLFTNFKEAIDGLPSIRAYGHSFGSFLENDNRDLLDASQQPIYLLYTVQRWLSLVLDLVVAGLAVLLIVLAIYVDAGTTGSDMGVALVSLMSFNQYLTHLVRYWASLETSLGTISRIKEFILSTPKADGSLGSPQSSHVSAEEVAGSAQEIIFKNATATYKKNTSGTQMDGEGAETSLGIDSIGLVIPPCTKLAITGRSGSGKSTLVSALFRILPVTSGSISIGGQDISQIDQEIIQRRMNAVTQSPYFLPGLSIRESLDPISRMELLASSKPSGGEAESQEMSLIKDTILQEILEKLRLWPTVEERGGLDAQLLPSSWSSGQLQLLSLARAIVKARNLRSHPGTGWRILVLDEATSGIESEFAALMRETIRQEFADHTILAIVHGFDDVMEDMDQMIVMDSGRISAQGPPGEILRQEYSQ